MWYYRSETYCYNVENNRFLLASMRVDGPKSVKWIVAHFWGQEGVKDGGDMMESQEGGQIGCVYVWPRVSLQRWGITLLTRETKYYN